MNIKDKIPELFKKHTPEVLSVGILHHNLNTLISDLKMSPEEREKKLYESLKEKYEGRR